jgi:hypothetical protein
MYQNYIYQTITNKNTALAEAPYIHYRTNKHEDLLRPAKN